MKKFFSLITVAVLGMGSLSAQVPKRILVEQFTNTYCSVCAGRNPGFVRNLGGQSTAIHLSIHPSSPYPSCTLNKHNKTENDDRIKHYNVYGSTPRLVIQGTVISSGADYSMASIFTPYLDQTSPLDVKITLNEDDDSIRTRIVVKTVSTHSHNTANLFVAIAEKTILFDAPNGENIHRNVFRKSVFPVAGLTITPAETIGDSIVILGAVKTQAEWKKSEIFAVASVSETNKAVIQCAASGQSLNTASVKKPSALDVKIYPNPSNGRVHIELEKNEASKVRLFSTTGVLLNEFTGSQEFDLDLSAYSKGLYFIQIETETAQKQERILLN
jgi:hypothetical protein